MSSSFINQVLRWLARPFVNDIRYRLLSNLGEEPWDARLVVSVAPKTCAVVVVHHLVFLPGTIEFCKLPYNSHGMGAREAIELPVVARTSALCQVDAEILFLLINDDANSVESSGQVDSKAVRLLSLDLQPLEGTATESWLVAQRGCAALVDGDHDVGPNSYHT